MEDNITYVTEEGLKKLQDEIEYLKTEERARVTKLIGEAKSFGDLSENSEYDAAKNKEAEVEMRIKALEETLKNVKIISHENIDISQVNLGCRVRLYDRTYEEEIIYKIMGEQESDPVNGIISNNSPVGQALIGKKVNDVVTVHIPDGILELEILEIMH